ncbi:hypothetical protein DICPUDRAFT_81630 [Dictyostelium purpureum]|uniref:Nucleolar protein 12 n=1 Tax=Dictyostelium purpureum TaxID=5786 RepID=F0ZU38_DICPU|nr:uncharacterized protein DICPUDRAFT_81630 [Dictyostelium purpureum]EGC32557.1 hypothetical protein DICPUDRAFT_81630 [Dictyostelium purpureum]|eukprot:XP_003290933.1 hypothetical protein DICPUDRAFT_81630 [Dictyostelium purpureum]
MSSVGFKLKGPPPKAPNYTAAAKNTDRVKEISYNEHDRKDFLTGFSRRKKERREFAMQRIAEKEKNEKKEQKKFAQLQREAFQQSIKDSKKKHQDEFGLEHSDEEECDTKDTQEEKIKNEVKKSFEISSDDKIVTTVIKPLSFNSDGEEEEEEEDEDMESEEEEEEEEEEEQDNENNKKHPVVKKTQTKKPEINKFKKEKDTVSPENLILINKDQKIYQDEKGRKIKMKKEKGKIIPVVLTQAAETALEKGWKLPRALRTKEKKSWSFATQKKSRKKARKEKKGK